jgi:branched-chain amino acid transport system ATP-binding protein
VALLEVAGLVRRFRGLAAVDGLSFTVEEGSTVAIIGPNGAGKSTAFNLISGLLRPNEGTIHLDGRDITRAPSHVRTRAGLGRTFQLVQPFHDLDVLGNVIVGALFGGGSKRTLAAARAEAERLCDFVGLGDRTAALATSLTIADRKRLELARALATGPRLLLLDELMEGLTPTEEREAIALLAQIRAQGVTLLLIEHVMTTVRDLSDHVIVMDYGKMLAQGDYVSVSSDPAVIAAYLGTEEAAS